MLSPKELEGEVDHSFFDSDDSRSSKDSGKNERSSETGRPRRKDSPSSQTQPCRTEVSGDYRASNPSEETHEDESGPCNTTYLISEPESKTGSIVVEKDVSVSSMRSSKILTSPSAEVREEDNADEDGYHQSEEESEEEEVPPPPKQSLKPNNEAKVGPPKKSYRRHRHRSPSPSSSEQDSDTDSSCDDVSSGENLIPEFHPVQTGPQSSRPSSSWPSSSPSQTCGQTPGRALKGNLEEDSEDTVTDVTPLSTPGVSPMQSLDLDLGPVGDREGEVKGQGVREQQELSESCSSSHLSIANQKEEDTDQGDGDHVFEGVAGRLDTDLVINCPGSRNRKNFSFTNEEVRRIDRENQRLLHELSRPPPRSRPVSAATGFITTPTTHPIRLYHSALNRQREQQRIERENLAFLRRLETVKPSRGLRRTEHLADYQRQTRYLGPTELPSLPQGPSRTSSRTSPGKSARPGRAVGRATHQPRGPRGTSSTSRATSTSPVTRSSRGGVPRAAWV
ncbi:cilia- and flagella-associated protein 97 [Osmerus mordax]|uniref:cilia- and flagella-associated protein 97 n=1 Tax=Osmerus mordax TaxID=8014 RepID=UPI00350FD91F